jgi:poly(3-hydroxybutyrate) depolymerase
MLSLISLKAIGQKVAMALGVLSLCLFLPTIPFSQEKNLVAWGTDLNPQAQRLASQQLAATLSNPQAATWRAKGDQKRTYRFEEAGATLPYRVCVPSTWDGQSQLPLVMFLHGAGNNESSYLDQDNKLMVRLAEEHKVLLVSPLGHQSAYGTFIRLPAVFDEQAEADKHLANITPQSKLANELSEKDVINVLEVVLNEYPIDSARVFLMGHSMGSGGTWYLGAKYSFYWRALAPMSGPFVLSKGYPWETVLKMPVFVTEGSNTSSTASSRKLRDWMIQQKGEVAFKEVNADHAGMVPLVLPDVFAFFDSVGEKPVFLNPQRFRAAQSKINTPVLSGRGLANTLGFQGAGFELEDRCDLQGRRVQSLETRREEP